MRIVFSLFLIVHGLVHLLYILPVPDKEKEKWPFSLTESWLGLEPGRLKRLGLSLMIAVVAFYSLTGLCLLIWPEPSALVYILGVIASLVSIILMAVFWNSNFVVGTSISIAILSWFLYLLL